MTHTKNVISPWNFNIKGKSLNFLTSNDLVQNFIYKMVINIFIINDNIFLQFKKKL